LEFEQSLTSTILVVANQRVLTEMKTIGDMVGRKIGMIVLVIAAGLLVSLAQLPVFAASDNSAAAACTPSFMLSTSRPITNNTRGSESILIASITSVCGLTGSIGWDVALVAPSHTATNAPTLGQSTYRVTLSPNGTRAVEFAANTNQNTMLTTWTITVSAFGLGIKQSLNVSLAVNDFTITANPTHITVKPGQNAISVVTATSINGFSGQIFYSGLLSPSTVSPESCNLQPPQPTISSGGSVASTLTCNFNTKGTYTMFESATLDSGGSSRNATITITVT
jgi:hypothetical protein